MRKLVKIPGVWMRGGTSKGLFFLEKDLPNDPTEQKSFLLSALGSPDPYEKQIDGLGGATSSTSKIVILRKSHRPNHDVDYLFGHVSITKPIIDYSGNCGNLTAAVGLYCVENGLIAPHSNGKVSIWQRNLQQSLEVLVPVTAKGDAIVDGSCNIAGVPFPGAPIKVGFLNPCGKQSPLPTGNAVDHLIDDDRPIECTLINAGNPTIFVKAHTLNLSGSESLTSINNDSNLLDKVERIRCLGAIKMGLANSTEEAASNPATPKVAVIAQAQDYQNSAGDIVDASTIDLVSRIFSMGRMHHAYTGTGAIALAVACNISGSIPNSYYSKSSTTESLVFGHSAGLMEASVEMSAAHPYTVHRCDIIRTARTLMRGEVFGWI